MKTFATLRAEYAWREIHGCPGRYRLVRQPPSLAPLSLCGDAARAREYRVGAARDPVVVVPLPGGGLISYRRADGSYCHTLNTVSGFARRLAQLGIPEAAAGTG